MNIAQIRAQISTIASYATLVCGAILALKLAGIQIPVPRDVNFWMACTIAAIALR